MDEASKNLLKIIALSVLGLLIIILIAKSEKKEPEYIQESFNNGRSIEVQVDEDLTSENWDCTGDCSGHEAGYSWAEENGIDDPSDCGGKSVSFIEGCEAYANEN